MHYASEHGHSEVVQVLLSHGATVDMKDEVSSIESEYLVIPMYRAPHTSYIYCALMVELTMVIPLTKLSALLAAYSDSIIFISL